MNYLPNAEPMMNSVLKIEAEDSYYEFVKQAFENVHTVSKGTPYTDNWHIKYVCDKIQGVIEKLRDGLPVKKLILNVPPGTMKSIMCTACPAAWAWAIGFPMHHLGLSNADDLASDQSQLTKDIVESNWYKSNWPEVKLRRGAEGVTDFWTTAGGRRVCFGMTGKWTGMHFHFISIDDPIDPGDVYSDTMREKTNTLIKEKTHTRHLNPNSFFVIIVAQRVHDSDPPGYILEMQKGEPEEERTWDWINLPGNDSEDNIYPEHLKEFYVNDPDPEFATGPKILFVGRFGAKELKEKLKTIGETAFRAQILQSPSSKSGELIRIEFIKTFDPATIPSDCMESYFADTAFGVDSTEKQAKGSDPDFSVLLGVKEHNGNLYICHRKKDKQQQPEWIKELMPWLFSTDFKPEMHEIRFEPKASGPGIKNTLRSSPIPYEGREYNLNVMFMDLPKDSRGLEKGKIARMADQLHKVEAGRVFVPQGNTPYKIHPEKGDPYEIMVEAWVPDFLETLRRFPKGSHDDDVDVLEMALRRKIRGYREMTESEQKEK